jgi:hypothetical protein
VIARRARQTAARLKLSLPCLVPSLSPRKSMANCSSSHTSRLREDPSLAMKRSSPCPQAALPKGPLASTTHHCRRSRQAGHHRTEGFPEQKGATTTTEFVLFVLPVLFLADNSKPSGKLSGKRAMHAMYPRRTDGRTPRAQASRVPIFGCGDCAPVRMGVT